MPLTTTERENQQKRISLLNDMHDKVDELANTVGPRISAADQQAAQLIVSELGRLGVAVLRTCGGA